MGSVRRPGFFSADRIKRSAMPQPLWAKKIATIIDERGEIKHVYPSTAKRGGGMWAGLRGDGRGLRRGRAVA